ncbi:stage II sporulation protein M [Atopomonas sediminilitoris]|uniref:stage II sporulation protein M n=1 Tax=Atopomonas sediminilitoris TaxID=2919919 RepID=UPI001F4E2E8C|nr:stage II sporulation protein M [Atopomonas sediminilitoris]MCJ8168678.1 stage II sporulation protein M [Atopomonas sediminilitoris]
MKQQQFEALRRADWQQFEQHLEQLEARSKHTRNLDDFPKRYRALCQDKALAQSRAYSNALVERLGQLVSRGHQQLYRHRSRTLSRVIGFLLAEFPRAVRREWRAVGIASAFFYGPALLVGTLIFFFPELIYSLMDAEQVRGMEQMYDPSARRFGEGALRESDSNWVMFGHYISNNIGIGFRTFATGLLLGIGSLFLLLFNGLVIGGVAGYLSQLGYVETFFGFVIAHGAFELTAITLAGAAGLKLGWALIAPGALSRLQALQQAAQQSMSLVYGVILFLLIAAFIEAFWSSMNLAFSTKLMVGAVMWLWVGAYLGWMGRTHATQ